MEQDTSSRLLRALHEGDDGELAAIIDAQESLPEPPGGDSKTWLHLLLERGMLEAARSIMSRCDVAATDARGTTPLMIAAANGYADTCAQLLSSGSYVGNGSLGSALALALEHRHLNICRLLVSFDRVVATQALFNAIVRDVACDVSMLMEAGLHPDSKIVLGKMSRCAIHEAVARPTIMSMLLRTGANVNARDRNGQTPLSLAAARGDIAMCEVLLSAGAALDIKDVHGRSPMFHACINEKETVVTHFIERGESVNTLDNMRRTPLFYHVERGQISACRFILRFNGDVYHQDASRWTVLHIAASLGLRSVCRLLMTEVARSTSLQIDSVRVSAPGTWFDDVFCKATAGPDAWTSVSESTLLRIYGDIIATGVKPIQNRLGSVMIRDFSMNTLLHLAAIHADDAQCAYVSRCLRSQGGLPVIIENYSGQSPLDLARQRGLTLSFKVLSELADLEETEGACVQLGGTISRSVGCTNHLSSAMPRLFTECNRSRLAQLCRGIESGVYSCADEIVWQIDDEFGDTVLHYFIRDICENEQAFPAIQRQQDAIESSSWLGGDARSVRVFISKRNWEGKTPLHVAAEHGALGFCMSLIAHGADAGEECSVPDKRLVHPTESCQYWKPANFCASVCQPRDTSQRSVLSRTYRVEEEVQQRTSLLDLLLSQPDSLPSQEPAVRNLRSNVHSHFPHLLPKLITKSDTVWGSIECVEAKVLFDKFLGQVYDSSSMGRGETWPHKDPTGVIVHKIFIKTEKSGVPSLSKYCVKNCIIESTGDTLMHLVAAHGHVSAVAMLQYLLTEGGMDVNQRNKQFKTPLHIACECQNSSDICVFLLANGADVTASCQNTKHPDVSPWFTPLYCALWSVLPSFDIVEALLSTSRAVVEPTNPRLGRSDGVIRRGGAISSASDLKWNATLLRKLVEVHPGALPLFLDHYAVEVNRLNGGMLYQFVSVRQACRDLDLVLRPATVDAKPFHKYSPSSCVTHPVVRNAIHLKWKLFGQRCHRRQLGLYTLMLVFFYLANVVLPKLDSSLSPSVRSSPPAFKWLDFASDVDYVVAGCKFSCWLLAAYHLVYVELYLEWRADHGRYWRSPWNLLDVGTYILMLATIPLEFLGDDARVVRECVLGLLSVLLCVNLMQALLVSSFFSVLIFTFARMCRVVAQFFFHYVLLLLGFAGGFHLLFHGYGPHATFLSTLRVVFLAMFGELDYLHNFYAADASLARNACGFALLVFYVVVVMIVAVNLLTALMTSEYEHVRSQAEERALLELAGALRRYEQWLGSHVVSSLYDSSRGVALLQACERRIPSEDTRRSRRPDRLSAHLRRGAYIGALPASTARSRELRVDSAVDAMADAVAAEVMRRVGEETTALRLEMAAALQEVQDGLARLQRAASPPPSPSALGRSASARDVAHVEAKLDALLALLTAR